ncbi:MAG: hypothetical protein QCI82_06230, partial [Candidatus Thermoplasmatota archaeon]|nr:hypothetical protein [Candidatus Thermoplasmatota archaeon]
TIPKLKKNRRPKASPLTQKEKELIDKTWKEKRYGTRMQSTRQYKEVPDYIDREGYEINHFKE